MKNGVCWSCGGDNVIQEPLASAMRLMKNGKLALLRWVGMGYASNNLTSIPLAMEFIEPSKGELECCQI
jgi:hypothetical protein